MHGSPMNMSISGNRGMGKTSILVKFEEIAKRNGCLVLRLSNYEGNVTNIVELAEYITTNLKREIILTKPLGPERERLKQFAASLTPTIGFGDVSLTLEREQVVQDMLRIRLQKLWAEMSDHFQACVILIDEAESLERIEGALIFLREVFQRLASDGNFTVVLAGKLNFPERMSESFSPLNRFFPCSSLEPFEQGEVEQYVQNQLALVDVTIERPVLQYICQRSEGHPYVLVAMCYMIFDALEDDSSIITEVLIATNWERISDRLAQDFFSPMYHPLTPKAKEILQAIATNAGGLEFTFADACRWAKKPRTKVSPYIQELMRKGVLNKLERAKYQIFHGLFACYVSGRLE